MPKYKVTWKEDDIEYSVTVSVHPKAFNAFHRIKEVKEILSTSPGYRGSFPGDKIVRIEQVSG